MMKITVSRETKVVGSRDGWLLHEFTGAYHVTLEIDVPEEEK